MSSRASYKLFLYQIIIEVVRLNFYMYRDKRPIFQVQPTT